ncbi:hypothetical protein HK102_010854, partial [Quaeritorhiza haematococci]
THVLRSSSSSHSEYITLNHKKVVIADNTVVTDKGFAEFRASKILFDDLVHDETASRSFIVYCIDQPLVPWGMSTEELEYLEETIFNFNDKAMALEDLKQLYEEMRGLLNMAFMIVGRFDEKQLNAVLQKYKITYDDLYQIIETYVMENTYEIVYFRVSSAHRDNDTFLGEAMSHIHNLDLNQMGLPPELGINLMVAIK